MRLTERMSVVVCGPASWNHLITLDRLPEPVPHMQFATGSVHTLGGTSAGKAVHLAALEVPAELHFLAADDDEGNRVTAALARAGVAATRHPSRTTEQHVNLMTDAGERISLYVATPSESDASTLDAVAAALRGAEVAVVDLSAIGAALIARGTGPAPLWSDLHDYDGRSAFHESFLRAADVVFMNDDATDDPWALLTSCLRRGPRLAVCTRGARGAIAMDAAGECFSVDAVPADVIDTNGAGDAFFAGFLAAHLAGRGVASCLEAGAAQAVVALGSEHMHPVLG